MEINFQGLGNRIKQYRLMMNLSQEQLADRANLNPFHISNIENARKAPSLDALFCIALALGVTPNALLIDSFPTTDSNDIDQLFAGCPADEAAVLLEAVKSLKQTLDKYRITHK